MKYEKFISDCYNLYTIKCDKFKNCHMEIIFKYKCSKENITSSALLFDVLMENNKTYNNNQSLIRRCEELYNLDMYSVNSRIGAMQLSNIVIDFLDPKYMAEGSIEEIIELAFDIIFNPNCENKEFNENTFNICSKRLLNEIDSLKDDLKQSSILDALKCLDNNSIRSFNMSGDKEILNNLTPKKLYNYYENLLDSSEVEIYIIGNLDMSKINKLISKYACFKSIKTDKTTVYLPEIKLKKPQNIDKKNDSKQVNLVQIYSLNNLDDYETNYVLPLFNMLWGTASLESKLYKTIRDENGLCYNINTFYQKYDRIIILHTSVDKINIDKTLKLIKSCMQSMNKGEISNDEINSVKKIIINSLEVIRDNPARLIDNYLFENMDLLSNIEDRIDEFKSVTIDDLISVSKKIKLILTYRIGG